MILRFGSTYSGRVQGGASRKTTGAARWFPAAALALAAAVTPAAAQQPSTHPDSIAARLERAEQLIAILQQQVAAEAQSGVQTRSRMRMELSGRVAMDAFVNTRRVNNVDNPQFARPDVAGGPNRGAGIAARHTRLGLAVMASDVAGGAFTGDVDVDFHGGQVPSGGGRHFPLIRMRTARAILAWEHAELLIGQEMPLFSPVNPESPAAVGTPGFTGAGNLWLWIPQVRITRDVWRSHTARFGVAGAILSPTSGDAAGAFDTDVDAAEATSKPSLEARLRLAWGEPGEAMTGQAGGDVGCGVHHGWIRAGAGGNELATFGVGCDARVPLLASLSLRGEAWHGEGLRSLGGGGAGQLLAPSGELVRSTAAWAQLLYDPTAAWSFGVGCGRDDPEDDDVGPTGRLRNDACAAHTVWRPAGPLFVGFEVRRLTTRLRDQPWTADHLNLAMGFEF